MKKEREDVRHTGEELLEAYHQQLKFLGDFCTRYDMGEEAYGIQIAVVLRVLLHRTRQSYALLDQLCETFLCRKPDFYDTSLQGPRMLNQGRTDFVRTNLCAYEIDHRADSDGIARPIPLKPEQGKRIPRRAFQTWWHGTALCKGGDRDKRAGRSVAGQ